MFCLQFLPPFQPEDWSNFLKLLYSGLLTSSGISSQSIAQWHNTYWRGQSRSGIMGGFEYDILRLSDYIILPPIRESLRSLIIKVTFCGKKVFSLSMTPMLDFIQRNTNIYGHSLISVFQNIKISSTNYLRMYFSSHYILSKHYQQRLKLTLTR